MFELPYPTDFALGGEGRLMDLDLQHYEIIFRGRIQSNVDQTTKTNEFGKGQIQNRVKFSCVGGGGGVIFNFYLFDFHFAPNDPKNSSSFRKFIFSNCRGEEVIKNHNLFSRFFTF